MIRLMQTTDPRKLFTEDQLIQSVQASYPEIYARSCPRRYDDSGKFYSPRYLSILAANSYLYSKAGFRSSFDAMADSPIYQKTETNESALSTYCTLSKLCQCGVPTYFVTPALLGAIDKTDLPKLRLCDIKWPLDGLLFMFPRNLVKAPHGYLRFIAVARRQAHEAIPPIWNETGSTCTKDGLTMSFADASEEGIAYTWSHPINEDPLDISATDPTVTNLASEEKAFLDKWTCCALQLILIMTARPELVTQGSLVKKARVASGSKKAKSELWAPNMLGQTYRTLTEGTGTHTSPRLHWRRGHFRLYEKGEHWKVTRTIWLEPVLVNP